MNTFALPKNYRAEVLKALEDVQVNDGRITFGASWTQAQADEAMQLLDANLKQLQVATVSKAYQPTEADYTKIKGMLIAQGGREYDVKKFGVYETVAADTKIDFTREKFTKRLLDAVVQQAIEGITILVNHKDDNMIGRTFDARVEAIPNDPGNFQLVVRFYIPDFSVMPNGTSAVDAINTRVANFTSVAIRSYLVEFEEMDSGYVRVYDHDPNRADLPAPIYVEHSVVYRGAQPRAAIKGYGPPVPTVNPSNIDMLDIIKSLKIGPKGAEKEFTVKVTGDPKSPEFRGLETIENHANDLASKVAKLEAENATLTEQAKAGKKSLVEGIRSLEKKLEQPETEEAMLYGQAHEDLEKKLEGLQKLDKKINPKGQIPGGNGGEGGEPADDDWEY